MDKIDMDLRQKSGSCYYSDGVECRNRNCIHCGWNPLVAEQRRKANRQKIMQEQERDLSRIRRSKQNGEVSS